MGNPRRTNGSRRTKLLAWLRAQGAPCWICGLPIDYGLPPGDPGAMECDEVVPVSRGGSPYDRANVRAAHRCCNNWRRTRPAQYVEQIRAAVAAAFGPSATPEQYVARARAVERSGPMRPAMDPPRTTTDW